jgi:transcriptional regulator of NAD metabolism
MCTQVNRAYIVRSRNASACGLYDKCDDIRRNKKERETARRYNKQVSRVEMVGEAAQQHIISGKEGTWLDIKI